MTKEQAKEFLPIITAFAEGKTIEVKDDGGEWTEVPCPVFRNVPERYRIKPNQNYRPFKNAKECWNEIEKHSHFGWVKFKGEEGDYVYCAGIEDRGIFYNCASWTFESMFDDFVFIDGSPFGIREE